MGTMGTTDAPLKISRVRSAHDLVAHGIGRGIIDGNLAVGSMLPGDAELMERFGVSRTALREALKTLAAKGLIESRTKVGTRVLDPAHWNMFDADILAWRLDQGMDQPFLERLFEIRQALEPLGAAAAALRRSKADIDRMRRAWAAMLRANHTRESFTRADLEFHRAVLLASANPFLRSIGAVIETALASSFALSAPIDSPQRLAEVGRQHRAVLDAIVARNPEDASRAMSTVILQGAKGAGIKRLRAPRVEIAITLFGR